VLVDDEGLVIPSLLMIQSGRLGNLVEYSEMNMHMAQNVLAETELRLLASTTSQIVSPSSNVPIIAIYQDSLLGSYRITREGVKFSARDAMNLLMSYPNVNPATLFERSRKEVTNFEVLSQIMPPLTLKYKTKLWDTDKKEDPATSNHYLEIYNGRYIRGQIEKSVLGGASKGILHRICNDYGKKTAAEFIDNIQNIVTEYMKVSSYSVGVSDLMSNRETHTRIIQAIQDKELEVAALIQKLHAGAFENNTSYSNKTEFEAQVNNVLNDATKKTDEISRQSLNADNRFLMIVNSGSKGSLLNISHMISCLGQVNVDSKRVPYGFDSRTLPHFCKFDDSPGARGFIKNSYIGGLNAHELFFHAMGGRIGLIDTAVKSVSWETPIVLLEKGKPVYTEIGRWIDGIIDNSSQESVKKYEEKNMELVNIDGGVVYVPTMDENGVVTWEEITAVTRHDPGNVLYEIKSLGGRSVIVTESKSLLIWNAEKRIFNEVLTPEIKVGDCLPVTMELCNPPTVSYELYTDSELIGMLRDIQSGKKYVIPTDIICNASGQRLVELLLEASIEKDEIQFKTNCEEDANKLAMLFSIAGRFVELKDNVVIFDTLNKYEHVENVVLDPIVEITPLSPEKYPKMYDLTIPSTLNFGLANGLQVRDTSQTGYIQRRLIKGLEDLKVEYDLTVRNSSGKVIQFSYGEDSFDPMFVENQSLPIVTMSTQDIYMHYDMVTTDKTDGDIKSVFNKSASARMGKQKDELRKTCKKYIDMMMNARDLAVKNIFNNKNLDSVLAPVAFIHIINNIQGNLGLASNSIVDITPLEAFQLIEEYFDKLNLLNYAKPNMLFETLYFYYLNPRELLFVKRFHRKGLILLLETVFLKYKQAIVNPGEMVGVVAGQSIGEPTTQLTLNSFVYETEILVRDDKGVVTSFQIGDFAKWGIETTSKMEYMADKDTTYAELSKFYEVPSATEDGNTVWRRIEAVTKHPVINEDGTNTMVKVTTKGNREIIATKAESFLQLIDGKIQGVNGSDLKVGDYLPVSKKSIDYTERFVLDLREVLPPTEYIYGTEMEKAKTVVNEYHWWSTHAGKTFTLPYTRSDSAYAVLQETKTRPNRIVYKPGYVYTMSNNICNYEIPEFIPLDYEFGYLIGAYCAEGCMTKHQVSIANNDLDYLKPIESWCSKYKLTTKIYCHKNKIQEGWTSQDIRIYSTLLCRILENMCGKLSHNKFISDLIVFSNKQCLLGFLDAYISGDGTVNKDHNRITGILMSSVSLKMLSHVQLILKNLGVIGKISKPKKTETNNRGSKDIKQIYVLSVTNEQSKILAKMLNLSIKSKQERIVTILDQTYMYEYCRSDLQIPNIINGELVMEDRAGRCPDLEFDQIVSIEEVPNTTDYAYDLTVEDTRNFDCKNGLSQKDTFHTAGVASKSNVTRGVPRIEEILRLTKNPKNPSMTVFLKSVDEGNPEKAKQFANMMEHTRLSDVVSSVQICFDPDEFNTRIEEDRKLVEQYYEFSRMLEECNGSDAPAEQSTKSKWIVRMEMDTETLLDKNITMDDIHFTVKNGSLGTDVDCVYADYNSDKLVFRVRMSNIASSKKRKGTAEPLDQTDEIHILKKFQDDLLNNTILRGVSGIVNVLPRKLNNMVSKVDGKYEKKDVWVLDTTGSNLLETLGMDYIDSQRTHSNDIREMFDVLGIEAARQVIHDEIVDVLEFSGAYANYHHLSLLCDRMTTKKDLVSIFRTGLFSDNIGPIAKATFEVHTEVLLDAARFGEADNMRGVSANVMCGQPGYYGTNSFQLVLDMNEMSKLAATQVSDKELDPMEELLGKSIDDSDVCPRSKIEIRNNIGNMKRTDPGLCDDGYNAGF
jgi:DNA-directed RNA polymerase beta' subunit